jgi:hypothetical protein
VRYEEPPEPLVSELQEFPWDWPEEELLAVLSVDDLRRVIDRFLAGEINAQQLQDWAERLECREDVGFDPANEGLIDDVFFRLAAPFINEPLTPETVSRMREQLCAPRA